VSQSEAVRRPVDDGWWRQAVVYQIYPRSFVDSNGDGIGDLNGIRTKVDYLEELGVDAVWLSPFYPSALADGGYDIDNPRDVDPILGNLEQFDALATELHDRGIAVIVDIVPNHTSDQHAWFREALRSRPNSAARRRYHFHSGTGPDGSDPPSDWHSAFGGSAWEEVADGQWYLHTFTREQPDLNWDNPEVRADFITTLRFWADRGVDGFRVDVAMMLVKDMREPLPSEADFASRSVGDHPYYDRDEVHEIYAEWRSVFETYDPPLMAVAEAWVPAERRIRYASPDGLGQAFNFDLLSAPWHPQSFRTIIAENLALAEQSASTPTWVLSNHDVVRHATRYGSQAPSENELEQHSASLDFTLDRGTEDAIDFQRGRQRARAATLLLLALPGSTYLYQGEELGLFEVTEIPVELRLDPVAIRSDGQVMGRDGCRVPLPWSVDQPAFGFSTGVPYLPQPAWFADFAASAELTQSSSTLNLYRAAIALRRSLRGPDGLTWKDTESSVLHFVRGNGWESITNFGHEPISVDRRTVLLSSQALVGDLLPVDTTAWIADRAPAEAPK
jgi:alpha-glucosidase